MAGAPAPSLRSDPDGPDDASRARRLAWATLLRRSFGLDPLRCPRCDGRMDLIAVIEGPLSVAKILAHLGLPARAPPRGRPWRRKALLAVEALSGVDGVDPPAFTE